MIIPALVETLWESKMRRELLWTLSCYNYTQIQSAELLNGRISIQFRNGVTYSIDPNVITSVWQIPNHMKRKGKWVRITGDGKIEHNIKIPQLSDLKIIGCELEYEILGDSSSVNLIFSKNFCLCLYWELLLQFCQPELSSLFSGYIDGWQYKIKKAIAALDNSVIGNIKYADICYTKSTDFNCAQVVSENKLKIRLYIGDTYTVDASLLWILVSSKSYSEILERLHRSKQTKSPCIKIFKASITENNLMLRIYCSGKIDKRFLRLTPWAILMLCDERFEFYWKKLNLDKNRDMWFMHDALWTFFPRSSMSYTPDTDELVFTEDAFK